MARLAAALGKRIVGLRADSRTIADNRAASVNLQLEHWITARGGSAEASLAAAKMAHLLG